MNVISIIYIHAKNLTRSTYSMKWKKKNPVKSHKFYTSYTLNNQNRQVIYFGIAKKKNNNNNINKNKVQGLS